MIGILGGTFDPIHEGHIQIADHILKALSLERIEFIPCFQPPHRDQPIASPDNRLAMVKLAVKEQKKFHANAIEIRRQGVSYTVDTLIALHEKMPHKIFCLILGADAFSHFSQWHEAQKILELTHLIVVSRKQFLSQTDAVLSDSVFTSTGITKKITDLHNQPAGLIYFEHIHPIHISATKIRKEIAAGKKKLPDLSRAVHAYILENKIYGECI